MEELFFPRQNRTESDEGTKLTGRALPKYDRESILPLLRLV